MHTTYNFKIESTIWWYVIIFYLLFALYKGLMMDWSNLKHVVKAQEREYKLCFASFIRVPLLSL